MVQRVLVPIASGTEEIEAVTVIDLMRRAGINVVVAGESEIVGCSRGVRIIPDVVIDEVADNEEFDAIVLPGGAKGTENLLNNAHLKAILKHNKGNGSFICAICAAPTILDEHGLLSKDMQITSHPSVKNQLLKYDYIEEPVVIANNTVTSRGAGTAVEFGLKIIELLAGEVASRKIAKDIMFME